MKTWLLLAAVALCSATVPAAEPIRIRGSDTLGAKLVPLLCQGYRNSHPDLRQGFDIAAEGSSTAFSSLLEGTADLGMSTRQIRSDESTAFAAKGLELDRIMLATDAFAIAVHASNPISDLSTSQLEGVFTGDLTNWKQLGGKDLSIEVLTRNTSSGSYRDFSALAMSGRPYAKAGQIVSAPDHPAHALANLPAAITYLPIVYAKTTGIRVLTLNGKSFDPSQPSAYPLSRSNYFYIRKDESPATKAFADWCVKSPEAQKIVVAAGFLPLGDATTDQKKTGTR